MKGILFVGLLWILLSLDWKPTQCAWQRPTRTALLQPIIKEIIVQEWKRPSIPFQAQLLQWSPGFYELRITLHNGSCIEETMVLGNKTIANTMRDQSLIFKHLGPDELLFQVEGKALLAFTPHYDNCGKYSQSFTILHAGVYHLSLIRQRQHYTAILDGYNYPPIVYEELVNQWLVLNQTFDHLLTLHPPKCFYGDSEGVWKMTSSSPFLNSSSLDIITETRKTFPKPWTFDRGENLTLPIYMPIEYPVKLSENCSRKEVNQFSWTSDGCGWNTINAEAGIRLLLNRKIIFSGDSHMRTLANHFIHYLCGVKVDATLKQPIYTDILKDHLHCNSLQIAFIEDLLCEKVPVFPTPNLTSSQPNYAVGGKTHHRAARSHSHSYPSHKKANDSPFLRKTPNYDANADHVIVNCGHHPAAYAKYTIEEYSDAVRDHIYRLFSHGYNTRILMWLESVPEPIRQDSFVFLHRDRRTLDRLRLFNLVAKEIIKDKGIDYIPSFTATLPFANKICDVGHFTPFGSNMPMIQHILRRLQQEMDV